MDHINEFLKGVVTPEQINKKDFLQANSAKRRNEAVISRYQKKIQELDSEHDARAAEILALQKQNAAVLEEIRAYRDGISEIMEINAQIDKQNVEGYKETQSEINE